MFIKINEENKVIFRCNLNQQPNEQDTFLVDSVPRVEVGKCLCFNPETREFYQEDSPDFVDRQEEHRLREELASLEKNEKDDLLEALKIMVEEHKSNSDKWKAWAEKHEGKKAKKEEIKKKIEAKKHPIK